MSVGAKKPSDRRWGPSTARGAGFAYVDVVAHEKTGAALVMSAAAAALECATAAELDEIAIVILGGGAKAGQSPELAAHLDRAATRALRWIAEVKAERERLSPQLYDDHGDPICDCNQPGCSMCNVPSEP